MISQVAICMPGPVKIGVDVDLWLAYSIAWPISHSIAQPHCAHRLVESRPLAGERKRWEARRRPSVFVYESSTPLEVNFSLFTHCQSDERR